MFFNNKRVKQYTLFKYLYYCNKCFLFLFVIKNTYLFFLVICFFVYCNHRFILLILKGSVLLSYLFKGLNIIVSVLIVLFIAVQLITYVIQLELSRFNWNLKSEDKDLKFKVDSLFLINFSLLTCIFHLYPYRLIN